MNNEMMELKLNQMAQQIEFLSKKLCQFMEKDRLRIVTVSELAEELHMSKSALYAKPWLMPNFGRTEGKKEWCRFEIDDWLSKGTEALYHEYLELGKTRAQAELVGSNA